MERGSKRKSSTSLAPSSAASPPSGRGTSASGPSNGDGGRAAKRLKTPEPSSAASPRRQGTHADSISTPTSAGKRGAGTVAQETPESTLETGQKFLDQLRGARDKNGNLIATAFLDLPSRKELPEYFEEIQLPISIGTMQAKLDAREYSNLTQLESDIKRMVWNAKSFNESKSEVFADAERIRKMTSNFMLKNNPAYKDKNYIAFPTPLPGEPGGAPSPVSASNPRTSRPAEDKTLAPASRSRSRGVRVSEKEEPPMTARTASPIVDKSLTTEPTKSARSSRTRKSAPAPELDEAEADKMQVDEEGDGNTAEDAVLVDDHEQNDDKVEGFATEGFKGKSFQEAQEQIMTEIINYKDESGLAIYTPFVMLPPRALKDYYELIKNPTSLSGVRKKVRGVHGRGEITGITDFKSWDAFEAEASRIWANARSYNEDGSEISQLAGELEELFTSLLAEAKKVVEEPPQPTLKLNLGAGKPSSAAPIKLRLGVKDSGSPAPASDQSPAPGDSKHRESPRPSSSTIATSAPADAVQDQIPDTVKGASASASSAANGVSLRASSRLRDSPALQTTDKQVNGFKMDGSSLRGQSPASLINRPGSSAASDITGVGGTTSNAGAVGQSSSTVASVSPGPTPEQLQQQRLAELHEQIKINPKEAYFPNPAPSSGFESRFRKKGNTIKDALLTNISITSHPELPNVRPYHVDIPPDRELTQYSVTLNLPSTHYNLRIQPMVNSALTHDITANPSLANILSATTGSNKPYKLFVHVNGQRMQPSFNPLAPHAPNMYAGHSLPPTDPSFDSAAGMVNGHPGRVGPSAASGGPLPMYDLKLPQGVNRIEVECVCMLQPPPPNQDRTSASTTNAPNATSRPSNTTSGVNGDGKENGIGAENNNDNSEDAGTNIEASDEVNERADRPANEQEMDSSQRQQPVQAIPKDPRDLLEMERVLILAHVLRGGY